MDGPGAWEHAERQQAGPDGEDRAGNQPGVLKSCVPAHSPQVCWCFMVSEKEATAHWNRECPGMGTIGVTMYAPAPLWISVGLPGDKG